MFLKLFTILLSSDFDGDGNCGVFVVTSKILKNIIIYIFK